LNDGLINHHLPWLTVKAAGYKVDFASPKGGKAPLDPSSVIRNFVLALDI
jgi:hypothetical protein